MYESWNVEEVAPMLPVTIVFWSSCLTSGTGVGDAVAGAGVAVAAPGIGVPLVKVPPVVPKEDGYEGIGVAETVAGEVADTRNALELSPSCSVRFCVEDRFAE